MTLEYAEIFRRRYKEEHGLDLSFTLAAGDKQLVEESNSSTPTEDTRKPTPGREGVLAHPGINTRTGERCWYVKIFDGPTQLESIRGDSPEAVIQRVFEMGLQGKAEKVPVQAQAQAPQPATPVRPAGPRLRPGSFRS
jgi:hypothetical protein